MLRVPILFGVAVLTLGHACAPAAVTQQQPASAPTAGTFDDVQSIFAAKCSTCHGADRSESGLRLDSWDHVMHGSDHGDVVIAFDPDNSLLLEVTTKLEGGAHPGGEHDTLTTEELATIRTWIADGARSATGEIPFVDSRNLVYVCNQGEAIVSVIDADANVVVRNVDLKKLGYGPTAKPHHVAVEPGGDHWYVSLIGANRVLKFSRDNELVGEVEFDVPGMLVYDSAKDRLYVGRSMSAVNPPRRIGVIDPATLSVDEIDVFVPRPHALAVSPSGEFVYTASLAQNTVVAVDAETFEATLSELPGAVHTLVQFAVAPDGSSLSAGGQLSGRFLKFATSDAPNIAASDSLTLGGMPWHPVFGPDGLLFVPNKGMNVVSVVDVTVPEVVDTIVGNGLAQPHGSAVSSDGRFVYVTNNNAKGDYQPRFDLGDNENIGTVVVIDVASRKIVKVLEVEGNTTGVGAVPTE